jgi:hypothetical protein
MASRIPFINDFVAKLCRQEAEVIQHHHNPNVQGMGQLEAQHRKYKRLKFGGSEAYKHSSN